MSLSQSKKLVRGSLNVSRVRIVNCQAQVQVQVRCLKIQSLKYFTLSFCVKLLCVCVRLGNYAQEHS